MSSFTKLGEHLKTCEKCKNWEICSKNNTVSYSYSGGWNFCSELNTIYKLGKKPLVENNNIVCSCVSCSVNFLPSTTQHVSEEKK